MIWRCELGARVSKQLTTVPDLRLVKYHLASLGVIDFAVPEPMIGQ